MTLFEYRSPSQFLYNHVFITNTSLMVFPGKWLTDCFKKSSKSCINTLFIAKTSIFVLVINNYGTQVIFRFQF